ncbi:MAG: RMD1 family protein [Myxococcales bacterium]|nr:RMD1 family protein [Myxococcales bacterium]
MDSAITSSSRVLIPTTVVSNPSSGGLEEGVEATARTHSFVAVGFSANFRMRSLASVLGDQPKAGGVVNVSLGQGTAFVYPFGVVVFHDVEPSQRHALLDRIRKHVGELSHEDIEETFQVREENTSRLALCDGRMVLDRLTPARAGVVALTLAQSVAMDHFEEAIERLSAETDGLVQRLRLRGSAPSRPRRLHRFIGEAVSTRNEILSVLHLLEKPDATWDDPAMDEIYDDLRGEFELGDRFTALETRLRSVQEALELILDVVRDNRLIWLEATIVLLILVEVVMMLPSVLP